MGRRVKKAEEEKPSKKHIFRSEWLDGGGGEGGLSFTIYVPEIDGERRRSRSSLGHS